MTVQRVLYMDCMCPTLAVCVHIFPFLQLRGDPKKHRKVNLPAFAASQRCEPLLAAAFCPPGHRGCHVTENYQYIGVFWRGSFSSVLLHSRVRHQLSSQLVRLQYQVSSTTYQAFDCSKLRRRQWPTSVCALLINPPVLPPLTPDSSISILLGCYKIPQSHYFN